MTQTTPTASAKAAPPTKETPAAEAKKDEVVSTAAEAKKVEGQSTVGAQTADNSPATGGGDHANISAPTQDPKNANVVPETETTHPKVVGKDDPATAGTSDYVGADSKDNESPTPDDATLDAMDQALGYRVGESQIDDTDRRNAEAAAAKIVKMINSMPPDAKDSLNIYGYGGIVISLGDLRHLLRGHPDLK